MQISITVYALFPFEAMRAVVDLLRLSGPMVCDNPGHKCLKISLSF